MHGNPENTRSRQVTDVDKHLRFSSNTASLLEVLQGHRSIDSVALSQGSLDRRFPEYPEIPDRWCRRRAEPKAARAVLKDLLPNSGTDIKGCMRSHAELLKASGYGSRPRDFDDLIRILDSEIRLVTPTAPEGKDTDADSVTQTEAGQKYFQLVDYIPESEAASWTEEDLQFVAGQLLQENSEFKPLLREILRPISKKFLRGVLT